MKKREKASVGHKKDQLEEGVEEGNRIELFTEGEWWKLERQMAIRRFFPRKFNRRLHTNKELVCLLSIQSWISFKRYQR
jgi:hypothetical protein